MIKKTLQKIVDYIPQQKGLRTELIADEHHDHDAGLEVGWMNGHRIHGRMIHCDIVDGEIYLEHDGTYFDVLDNFLEAEIKDSEIVLGFNPPNPRKLTKFALT